MLNLTYDYKLKPTKKQIEIIEHNLDVCKSVWNHALYERKLWYNSRSCKVNMCSLNSEYIVEPFEYPSYHNQSAKLTLAKKNNAFLKSGNAQAMQQTLRKLDRAFNDMNRIALLHEAVVNRRKNYHFKLAHQLCIDVGMIFVEDINFTSWSNGLFRKQSLDMGLGQFFIILEYVGSQTDTYFCKVDKNYTSQICPNCGTNTGKKELSERVHHCQECGFEIDRDIAASMVIRDRGLNIVAAGASVT